MGRRADRATAPGCSAVGLADGDSPVRRSDGLAEREGDRWPATVVSTGEAARVRRRPLEMAAEAAEGAAREDCRREGAGGSSRECGDALVADGLFGECMHDGLFGSNILRRRARGTRE